MKKRFFYLAYLVCVVVVTLAIIEFISKRIPEPQSKTKTTLAELKKISTLDPHLGYAYPEEGPWIAELKKRGHRVDKGFVIYGGVKPEKEFESPVVMILGGSTSDPIIFGHSWPEELFNIMRLNNQKGTIINGAVVAYSSNQELLKLIRDGLEFKPDLVISYGGLIDRPSVSLLPYPMVSKYQRRILKTLTKEASILPNTVRAFKGIAGVQKNEYTLGVPTKRSSAEWWKRNIGLMHAVSNHSGADFCVILQPYRKEATSLREFSTAQIDASKQTKFVHDFTHIFDSIDGALEDNAHATALGNKVIAEKVFDLVFKKSGCFTRNVKKSEL